ncbi:nitronate monooxygenase, partial [Nocardia beijingensis]|uniref:nitronate monooxygenase n=1 Tax=Nocardia beijingensis TaxID=95162 RepID=UPI00344F3D43
YLAGEYRDGKFVELAAQQLPHSLGLLYEDLTAATAPTGYPEIHYATAPLRAAARAAGNPDEVNLWAGQTHELAPELPAGELVATLAADTKAALEKALSRRIQHY